MYPIISSYKRFSLWMCLGLLYKFKSLFGLGRTHDFRLYPSPRKTGGSIPMGSITRHLFKPMPHHAVPSAYSRIYTEQAAFYVNAVFLLREREMACIEGFSSNLLYAFFKFIEHNISQIARDIEDGELKSLFDIDEDVRSELNKFLHPDPERAQHIRLEFSKGKTS